jgi:general secretion pathway protein G
MQIAAFMAALDAYKADVEDLPTETQGLPALWANPGIHGWNGPYLRLEIPLDPWGVPYRYVLANGHPIISSLDGGTARSERAIWSEGTSRK